MTTVDVQVQDRYGDFMREYPGAFAVSAKDRFVEACASGWTPDELIAGARAYRLLTEAQDAHPRPAVDWLAMMARTYETADDCEAEAFAAALRALRAAQNISQVELADRAELAAATLGRIENCQHPLPRRSTRLTIADALGMSVDDMVDLGYRVLGR